MKIRDALGETYLLTANPSATLSTSPPTSFSGNHWGGRLSAFPFRGEGITCKSASMGHSMAMSVLRRVEWDEIVVLDRGQRVTVPVDETTFVCAFSTDGGHIKENETHPLWRLAAEIDVGSMLVFCIERRGERWGPPSPNLKRALLEEDDFYPPVCSVRASGASASSEETGGSYEYTKYTPLILVALSLVGCTPRADFEPLGALKACRIYPQTYLFSTVALTDVRVELGFGRGPTTSHVGPEMRPAIKASLYTDRNESWLTLLSGSTLGLGPRWDVVFDYYAHGQDHQFKAARSQSEAAADPSARRDTTSRRRLDVKPLELNIASVLPHKVAERFVERFVDRSLKTSSGALNFEYVETEVVKTERQGEFDNVHMAPRMVVDVGDPAVTEVEMAPICQHDCLHTHWRWGTGYDKLPFNAKPMRGWGSVGPHTVQGAPLTPPDQSIDIHSVQVYPGAGGPGIRYRASIESVGPGRLHAVNHHGSAYGVELIMPALMKIPSLSALLASPIVLVRGGGPDALAGGLDKLAAWPLDGEFYHRLQYELFRQSKYDDSRISMRRLIFDLPTLRAL